MVDVSFIIVNWNTLEITKDCIESVEKEMKSSSYEIILVDNNSSDGSREFFEQNYSKHHLILNDDNLGFAKANNQGIAQANGRYLLLLNSDTIVLDNAVDKCVFYMDRQPDTGVLGCRILNDDRTLQRSCSQFPSILNQFIFISGLNQIFSKNRFWGREKLTWWDYSHNLDVDVVSGCFMLIRKEAIEQVGGFDEQFFMYSEEVDWCLRFKKHGWRISFYSDAEIIHLGGASAKRYGSKRAIIKDESTMKYIFKHWNKPKAHLYHFLMYVFYVSRIFIVLPLIGITWRKKYRGIFSNHIAGLSALHKIPLAPGKK